VPIPKTSEIITMNSTVIATELEIVGLG